MNTRKHDTIAVLDFGSQYNQLIVRRIRQLGVYAKLLPHTTDLAALSAPSIKGIILSGSPQSVTDDTSHRLTQQFWNDVRVPILGICYGMQHMVDALGGAVSRGRKHEYGAAKITLQNHPQASRCENPLFEGIPDTSVVWMSHGDSVVDLPPGWTTVAASTNCPHAAAQSPDARYHAIQFHPEVTHTEHGMRVLENFVFGICGAAATWNMKQYMNEQLDRVVEQVGSSNVICGLSGGVDSAVTAALLEKAIGDQLHCIFVDNGLLRKNERDEVEAIFSGAFRGILHVVDASDEFLTALKGVSDPEKKRKIIGVTFIKVFQTHADAVQNARFLAQGTLYTDIVESGSGGASHTIKSHHNVGGLPKDMKFSLIEPLRSLYKDEARALGLELGLPESLVHRQPFPGPGLAVRVLGNITPHALHVVRESDAIVREEIARAGLDKAIWQHFTVLTGVKTVGVKGDARVYGETVAVRAVSSVDGMTSAAYPIPFEVLEIISSRVVNEIESVNRVVYDITSKPPGTIEWE